MGYWRENLNRHEPTIRYPPPPPTPNSRVSIQRDDERYWKLSVGKQRQSTRVRCHK